MDYICRNQKVFDAGQRLFESFRTSDDNGDAQVSFPEFIEALKNVSWHAMWFMNDGNRTYSYKASICCWLIISHHDQMAGVWGRFTQPTMLCILYTPTQWGNYRHCMSHKLKTLEHDI